jgi:hypothetical protein
MKTDDEIAEFETIYDGQLTLLWQCKECKETFFAPREAHHHECEVKNEIAELEVMREELVDQRFDCSEIKILREEF